MTRSNLFKASLIVITVMLWCSLPGLTQSVKSPGMNITTTSKAQMNKRQNVTEERIYKKEFAKYNCTCDMHMKLVQTKTELESGIASKRLSADQIKQLKSRVTALESRLNTSGCQAINNSNSPVNTFSSRQKPGENSKNSVSPGEKSRSTVEYSRDQFKNLSVEVQRQVLTSHRELIITDLINATPEMMNNRVENIIYIPASGFRNADVKRKQAILNNPNRYVVVSDGTLVPKSKISQSQFDALPAAKRQAILDSGQYEITN